MAFTFILTRFVVKKSMLSVTPIRPKNVSFQLPGSTQRTITSPAATQVKSPPTQPPPPPPQTQALKSPSPAHHVLKSPPPNSRERQAAASPLSTVKPTVTRISSPQPDLIADILDQPEDTKSGSKKKDTWVPKDSQVSGQDTKSSQAVPMKEMSIDKLDKQDQKASRTKPEKRVPSGQSRAMKSKWSKGHKSTIATALSVSPTATGGRKTSQIGQVTKMAFQIRDQTNVACLDHTRWMKHDVAKIREHVIKIEEEIKLGNKAKVTLDAKIFDLRKCLSVNQQSISAQQKKTHREVC